MHVVSIIFWVIVWLVMVPTMCVLIAIRLGSVFPRFGYRMRVAWVWVVTRIFPGFWQWLEAKNFDPVRRFYIWLERDPAEQRGELDA
jgi:hypothetical protein